MQRDKERDRFTRRIFERIRLSTRFLLQVPAFPALYFLILGILAIGLLDLYGLPISVACLVFMGGIGMALCIFPRRLWKWSVMTIVAILISLFYSLSPWQTYRKHLVREQGFVEVKAVMTDSELPMDDTFAWLGEQKYVELTLRKIRLSRFEQWQSCKGRVLLKKPDKLSIHYAQMLHIRGSLRLPYEPSVPGIMNYRHYLRINGIRHILLPDTVIILTDQPRTWHRIMARLYRFRQSLVNRLVRHLESGSHQRIIAAMTLGFRRSIPATERERYLRSGMIHLFAISGLHVGILYSVLIVLCMLARVPFTVRYCLIPILLLLYVIMTGAAPSAIRAWVMLSIWSFGRGLYLPALPTNTIVSAALILLLFKPYYLFHIGFQFSFAVVLSLIWGWRFGQHLIHYCFETALWKPGRQGGPYPFGQRLGFTMLKSFMSMTAAWLGAFGLTAYYNHLFLPSSIISNFLLCFLAVWIMIVAFLKGVVSIVFFFWSGADWLVAYILSLLLSILQGLAIVSSDYGGAMIIPQPGLLMTFLYYGLLVFFFLSLCRLRLFFWTASLLMTTMMLITLGVGAKLAYAEISLFVSAGNPIPAIIIRPSMAPNRPILINPGRGTGYELGQWLQAQGIASLDKVLILKNRSDYYRGFFQLSRSLDIATLLLFADDRRNIRKIQQLQWENGGRSHFYYRQQKVILPKLHIYRRTANAKLQEYYRIEYTDSHSIINIELKHLPFQGVDVHIEKYTPRTGRKIDKNWRFHYTNKSSIWRF